MLRGWSLYANRRIRNKSGKLVSVDLQPLPIAIHEKLITENKHFHFIEGDFNDKCVKENVYSCIDTNSESDKGCFDVVMSDMATSFTGDKFTDALRTMNLCLEALTFSIGFDKLYPESTSQQHLTRFDQGVLKRGGIFLCKYFSCGKEQEHDLLKHVKHHFTYSKSLKPHASRKESAEKYLLAVGYRN